MSRKTFSSGITREGERERFLSSNCYSSHSKSRHEHILHSIQYEASALYTCCIAYVLYTACVYRFPLEWNRMECKMEDGKREHNTNSFGAWSSQSTHLIHLALCGEEICLDSGDFIKKYRTIEWASYFEIVKKKAFQKANISIDEGQTLYTYTQYTCS